MRQLRPKPSGETFTVWILRRGSGRRQVHPSPLRVRQGDTIRVKNWTPRAARVSFKPALYPLQQKLRTPVSPVKATIPTGRSRDFTVVVPLGFFEYEVTFGSELLYAEGGSKPGVIVDP
jgi:hypothetical protein